MDDPVRDVRYPGGAVVASDRPRLSPSVIASIVAALLLGPLAGVLVGGGEPATTSAESLLAGTAFAAAIGGPALVALLVAKRCPVLLIACGIALLPRIPLSFSPIFFPLLWPATALVWAGSQEPRCTRHGAMRHAVGGSLLWLLFLLPLIALFVTQDPRSYTFDGGSGSTSDVIAVHESLLSLAASGLAAATALGLAAGRPRSADGQGEAGEHRR
jgi:hypothetical protein